MKNTYCRLLVSTFVLAGVSTLVLKIQAQPSDRGSAIDSGIGEQQPRQSLANAMQRLRLGMSQAEVEQLIGTSKLQDKGGLVFGCLCVETFETKTREILVLKWVDGRLREARLQDCHGTIIAAIPRSK